MRAEWTTTRRDGVTLVRGVLSNDGPARRVRVTNDLDGPVWPPRRRGVPEPGWDGDRAAVTLTVPANGTRAVGYATPAAPTDDEPPATVEWGDRVVDEPAFDRHPDVPAIDATPEAVVAALSDPRPPRAAVPATVDVDDPSATAGAAASTTEEDTAPDDPGDEAHSTEAESEPSSVAVDAEPSTAEPATPNAVGISADADLDGGALGGVDLGCVDLDAVERRVERAEALEAAGTLPEATRAVEAVDGLAGVRSLTDRLATDADALRALEAELAALRKRCERASVPVERLEALA